MSEIKPIPWGEFPVIDDSRERELNPPRRNNSGSFIVGTGGVFPFKIKYRPFFKQLQDQITAAIKKHTAKNFVKYHNFSFSARGCEREGPPYVIKRIDYFGKIHYDTSTFYYRDFFRFHWDGYAYGRLEVDDKAGRYDAVPIWIRWKSNLPDYPYIEPDDELDLKPDDITFEICKTVPKELPIRFYGNHADEYTCDGWIKYINDERHYPRRRGKQKQDFPCEISEQCEFPDTTFTLYFEENKTEELKEAVFAEFEDFQENWDLKHFFGIHDIMDAEDLDRPCEDNAVRVLVDFGSSDYKIVEALIKWLRTSRIKISKVTIE